MKSPHEGKSAWADFARVKCQIAGPEFIRLI